ncbi:MAG TPA: HutD family protein [Steroidobacteraceae bacterium]|nr:HutD family protein [Steroidobacteraceae bacterium]
MIRRSAFKTSRWKNGGGVTHEAIRVPSHGASFRWRISVAEIAAAGPFSDFAGYRRHMVLLEGGGLRLHFSYGASRELRRPGDLVEFDGALRADCELVDGPCVDLNLLTERAAVDADVRVATLNEPLAIDVVPGATRAVVCVAGEILVDGGDARRETLGRWDLAVLGDARRAVLRTAGKPPNGALAFVATIAARASLTFEGEDHGG